MATPEYKELLTGVTYWQFKHDHVPIKIVFHSYNEKPGSGYLHMDTHPGTWNYYLMIPEPMYLHRWDIDFKVMYDTSPFGTLPGAFDDDMFRMGISDYGSEPYFCRHEKRWFDSTRVGCDYNHASNINRGLPDTLESVICDAKYSAEKFVTMHPDFRIRSDYSGRYGNRDEMYQTDRGYWRRIDERGE